MCYLVPRYIGRSQTLTSFMYYRPFDAESSTIACNVCASRTLQTIGMEQFNFAARPQLVWEDQQVMAAPAAADVTIMPSQSVS